MREFASSPSIRRRTLLGLGSLALGNVSLPGVLAAQQSQGVRNSDRAVILVWLYGGPTQLETYDLKPLAPSEYRSQFSPIYRHLEIDYTQSFADYFGRPVPILSDARPIREL